MPVPAGCRRAAAAGPAPPLTPAARARPAGARRCGAAGALALALALADARAQAPPFDELPPPRMGAFQCLLCASGGTVSGISPSHGRTLRRFDGFQELCVADYRYIDGRLYLRFTLDGRLWPEDGAWRVQASSWEAVCARETVR